LIAVNIDRRDIARTLRGRAVEKVKGDAITAYMATISKLAATGVRATNSG
jgi:hypothetical protein